MAAIQYTNDPNAASVARGSDTSFLSLLVIIATMTIFAFTIVMYLMDSNDIDTNFAAGD